MGFFTDLVGYFFFGVSPETPEEAQRREADLAKARTLATDIRGRIIMTYDDPKPMLEILADEVAALEAEPLRAAPGMGFWKRMRTLSRLMDEYDRERRKNTQSKRGPQYCAKCGRPLDEGYWHNGGWYGAECIHYYVSRDESWRLVKKRAQ